MRRLQYFVLMMILGLLPGYSAAYEYNSFGSEQDDCFARAMIGFDSVINSRLGVPPEHALNLTVQTNTTDAATPQYDQDTLNVMLHAYLWKDTPHTYAVKVFFSCAQQKAYNKQARVQ
ncbi:MAG: hypothetical protein PVF34_03410 [Gammaproteobacteria bacterium]